MNKLISIPAILAGIALLLFFSCNKNEDPQPMDPAMNPDNILIKICHNTGTDFTVIEIDPDAWPGHQSHGDVFYEEFPLVGVFKWEIDFGTDSTHLHTMYITEVTETTFSGYGIDQYDDREWTLTDGTIYADESWSFTMDYDNSSDYLDCSGSFVCGEGLTGTFGGTNSGTLTGSYNGGIPDDNDVVEINP